MRAAAIFLGCLVAGASGAAQGVADVARLAENPSVRAALRSIQVRVSTRCFPEARTSR
jgi:hypothetical protein